MFRKNLICFLDGTVSQTVIGPDTNPNQRMVNSIFENCLVTLRIFI